MALTPEQLARRKTGIGASEVSAILGKSEYAGPLEIFHEKMGTAPAFEGNRFVLFGAECEDVAARIYEMHYCPHDARLIHAAEHHGLVEREIPHVEHVTDGTFRHRELPFLMCTPDRLYSDLSRLVEIKWISTYSWKKSFATLEKGEPKVNLDYHLQTLYQQFFFGIHSAHLAVGFGGNALRVFDITYKQGWVDAMIPKLRAFWEWVERGEPNPAWTPVPKKVFPDADPLPTSYEHSQALITSI